MVISLPLLSCESPGSVKENPDRKKIIKTRNREKLIPTFTNVKLAIKTGNIKLRKKIAYLILKMELQNKHFQK